MRILGIETSCDETAAAVVEEVDDPARPWLLRSNVVASQADIHREWGGVVPELASRQHVRDICGVVERALDAGRLDARRHRRHCRDARARAGRLAARRRVVRQVARRLARAAAGAGAPPRGPHRVALPPQRPPAAASRGARRVGRAHEPLRGDRTRAYQLAGPHARRCGGGGLRQGREAARARVSGRAGDRSGGRATATIARSISRRCASPTRIGARPTIPAGSISASAASRPRCCASSDARDSAAATRRASAEQRNRGPLRQFPARGRRDAARSHVRAARRYGAASVGIAGGVSANSRLRADALARGDARGHCRCSSRAWRCRPTTPR